MTKNMGKTISKNSELTNKLQLFNKTDIPKSIFDEILSPNKKKRKITQKSTGIKTKKRKIKNKFL